MSKKIRLGKLSMSAVEYGSQGNAVLGIRDSGKTYTSIAIAEQLFDAGIPFLTFDPVGVWRFMRVPGKGKGYPIVVAGGKAGDLPLTVAGAPEIVRAAMKNGVSLVIDLFDMHLSKANWRQIVKDCVKVLLHENKEHGLRHIFLEEAAEFAPQKVLEGDVYAEIEKLARMGGNSRLGYTLINQRAQELNKAVLELCENLFLHRQRGKNAIESLSKWLDIADVGSRQEIVKSLPDLPQGTCWAWIGGDKPKPPLLIEVQPKNSLHPDRRVMHGGKGARIKKAVNVGSFVAGMKGSLLKLEEEHKANDPTALRRQIVEKDRKITAMERELTSKSTTPAPSKKADQTALTAAEKRGFEQAKKKFGPAAERALNKAIGEGWKATIKRARGLADEIEGDFKALRKAMPGLDADMTYTPPAQPAARVAPQRPMLVPRPVPVSRVTAAAGDGADRSNEYEQKLLDALSELAALGVHDPARELVCLMARYSPHTNAVKSAIVALQRTGKVAITRPGCLSLTPEGAAIASPANAPRNSEEMRARIFGVLGPPSDRFLEHLSSLYPNDCSREELANACGMSINTNNVKSTIVKLKEMGFITYPGQGRVRADESLFVSAAA